MAGRQKIGVGRWVAELSWGPPYGSAVRWPCGSMRWSAAVRIRRPLASVRLCGEPCDLAADGFQELNLANQTAASACPPWPA